MSNHNPFSNTARVAPTDLVLINRNDGGWQSYYVEAQNIVDGRDDDILLVNRAGVSHQCTVANLENARDTDLVLVNRMVDGNMQSYSATIGDLRGQLSVPITFDITIQTSKRDISWSGGGLCSGNRSLSVNGGRVTATITAKTLDTYTCSNSVFSINGEWIVVCGQPGDFGFQNQWQNFGEDGYKNCATYGTNSNQAPQGFSPIGNNTFPGQNQGARTNWGSGPPGSGGTYGNTGQGGFGAPGGAAGSGGTNQGGQGGYSQTRPRSENSEPTWNEITVENYTFTTGNWGSSFSMSSGGNTTTATSGVIGEVLNP